MLYAQLEFVYLHNARVKDAPLLFIMRNKERFRGKIYEFDPYSVIIDDAGVKIHIFKRDIATVASAKTIIDVDYISKTYYQAHRGRHPKHTRPPMQDIFLNEVRKSKSPVIAYLTNGVKVRGLLIGFDDYVLLTSYEDRQQLIYKSAISTVFPLYQQGEIIKYDDER
ncbi:MULTISPECIES: RNA chaperone Hfq [Deferribacter]|uniref:RNA chaperone Hfq n=1 Tax=Deferribacter autotrophicus TaxID=500465 RepID=A0A5A8F3L8_9BACT|nr:RNA chaperone Hfq [Deferribacter autotrophicus]KAA0258794.1 RNA chaperone Hfq [Deferribacter autotrophicus]